MHEVIIVGSGLSATGAALELVAQGIRPLLLDVGQTPTQDCKVDANLYEYRKTHDIHALTIGDRMQGLANLLGNRVVPVKLNAPNSGYVTSGSDTHGPLGESGFSAVQSFAVGGLANAWGAGCYRFDDQDLAGYPLSRAELEPYYDKLTREIGISGTADDLEPFLGSAAGLQPPLRLGRNMQRLLDRYRKLRNRPRDLYLGRARIGALSQALEERPATRYRNLEFFQEDASIYSPRYTLQRLIDKGQLELRRGFLVQSWRETDAIEVTALELESGTVQTFRTRRLLLAAGAINSSKIVLASAQDYQTTLPLQENPALQIPLLLPTMLGKALQTDAFGLVQLNLVWDAAPYQARLQGSLMEITAPARAEFFAGMPLSARANLALIRHLLPAMCVMQLFFPGDAQAAAALSLEKDGTLRIHSDAQPVDTAGLGPLLRFLARLGAWTQRSLIIPVPNGHAIHYAGTLPMQSTPAHYQCYPDGRLFGTKQVYIADSANLTRLPAKNMSFTMMANAMRIAAGIAQRIHTT